MRALRRLWPEGAACVAFFVAVVLFERWAAESDMIALTSAEGVLTVGGMCVGFLLRRFNLLLSPVALGAPFCALFMGPDNLARLILVAMAGSGAWYGLMWGEFAGEGKHAGQP